MPEHLLSHQNTARTQPLSISISRQSRKKVRVTWTSVTDAKVYTVKMDGNTLRVAGCEQCFDNLGLGTKYTVQVQALDRFNLCLEQASSSFRSGKIMIMKYDCLDLIR